MKSGAVISACGRYRYSLTRAWGHGAPVLVFIMLNPSTADADVDDPTIRRCIGFAKGLFYSAIEVVNLYAYRATDPADLKANGWQVGPDNDDYIVQAVTQNLNGVAVCAWGANAQPERARAVFELISPWCVPVRLGLTHAGHPRHPLYLPADSDLRLYEPTSSGAQAF